MYVPAYPLPLIEIGSFVKSQLPEVPIRVISMPMDYGIPLTREGKEEIYRELIRDVSKTAPKGIGISCTAIAQAGEVIHLCEFIKDYDPNIFVFLGGYFPTIYYEEILFRTSAVDLIVVGEGEEPALRIIELLEMGKDPIDESVPNIAWKEGDQIRLTKKRSRFDLKKKAMLNPGLLRDPGEYDILPYAFSRGCPYQCNFCMEQFIRPVRKEVPTDIVRKDLKRFSEHSNAHTLLISDALFKSFDVFPLLRSLGMKVNFETRCDVLDPTLIPAIADVCGVLALGFESASFSTLRRMNKVKDHSHYEKYLSNAAAIFKEAARNEIPMVIFMIAGYPGDTEGDLEESLMFARQLSKHGGPAGHVFKIGECHVYPKTKIYELALSLPDVIFDDDGVLGQNIVRQPSKNLDFETVLAYSKEIFNLSHYTPKLQAAILNVMPFFRLPSQSLTDDIIPDLCFKHSDKSILHVHRKSLLSFREVVPRLTEEYKTSMSSQRSTRSLPF